MVQQHQPAMILPYLLLRQRPLAQLQDERGLALRHARLEAAFEEGSAQRGGQGAGGVAPAAEGDQPGAAEEGGAGDGEADCYGGHGAGLGGEVGEGVSAVAG